MKFVQGYFGLVARWRWSILLAMLLAAFLMRPIFGEGFVNELAILLVYALIFAGAIYSTDIPERQARKWIVFLSLWVLMQVIDTFADARVLANLTFLADSIFVFGALALTFRELATNRHRSLDKIVGAIFGYFLIAMAFAMFYGKLEVWRPGSFSLISETDLPSQFLYYSLVTLTTLGYGDVLPVSPLAQIVAGLQAVLGTLYIAVLIGRIVGQFTE